MPQLSYLQIIFCPFCFLVPFIAFIVSLEIALQVKDCPTVQSCAMPCEALLQFCLATADNRNFTCITTVQSSWAPVCRLKSPTGNGLCYLAGQWSKLFAACLVTAWQEPFLPAARIGVRCSFPGPSDGHPFTTQQSNQTPKSSAAAEFLEAAVGECVIRCLQTGVACAAQRGREQIWWSVWRCLDPHSQQALLEYSLSLLGGGQEGRS